MKQIKDLGSLIENLLGRFETKMQTKSLGASIADASIQKRKGEERSVYLKELNRLRLREEYEQYGEFYERLFDEVGQDSVLFKERIGIGYNMEGKLKIDSSCGFMLKSYSYHSQFTHNRGKKCLSIDLNEGYRDGTIPINLDVEGMCVNETYVEEMHVDKTRARLIGSQTEFITYYIKTLVKGFPPELIEDWKSNFYPEYLSSILSSRIARELKETKSQFKERGIWKMQGVLLKYFKWEFSVKGETDRKLDSLRAIQRNKLPAGLYERLGEVLMDEPSNYDKRWSRIIMK